MKDLTFQLAQLNKNLETLISIFSSDKPSQRNAVSDLNEIVRGLIINAAKSNPNSPAVRIRSLNTEGIQETNIGGIFVSEILENHPSSSCISKIQYEASTEELRVTFKQTNKTYS